MGTVVMTIVLCIETSTYIIEGERLSELSLSRLAYALLKIYI